ncbi:MAG: hypothetical protein IJ745_06020 [Bacteroidales bacterium]|nr:hypothetical protein [Bacteroidales bacterium]
MKTEKKEYTAPALTVVTFKSERGFAASGSPLEALKFWDSGDDGQTESYGDADWSGNGFWN